MTQVSKNFVTSWLMLSTQNVYGENPAIFWGKHTGEAGSVQCLRLRSITNPDHIIWESAGESLTTGTVSIYVDAWTPENFQSIRIRQMLTSDMDLTNHVYTTLRSAEFLNINDFPAYVTQEYKGTTDWHYLIRYLGYIGQNPTQYQNSTYAPVNMDEMAKEWGISLSQVNNTGKPLNLSIKVNDGTQINGILPPGAAFAVIRLGYNQRAYGYIMKEGLITMPTPGIQPPLQLYLQYFVAF